MDEEFFDKKAKQKSESSSTQYQAHSTSELLNYLDIEPEFRLLMADLAGMRWEENSRSFIHDPSKPKLMNNLGVSNVARSLRAYFSKSAVINHFNDNEVSKIMLDWAEFVKKMILFDSMRKDYGIQVRDRWLIRQMLLTAPYININRSRDGNELIAITQMVKSKEEVRQQLENKGGFSLNPFKIIQKR